MKPIVNEGETIAPQCPHCEAINEKWAKGPEYVETNRRCTNCGKVSGVWYYRVYIVGAPKK